MIYSSTSSGYGFNEKPNHENQRDNCLNPYSVSKVSGEKLCKMYNDLFGLKTVIFRYFNVYGERSPIKGQYAPVIGIFLRQLKDNEPLTIVGDGEQRRDFTHVSDVVQANILAAIKDVNDEFYGDLYNVGNGINYSINEIANTISENQTNIPPRIGESRTTLANNNKIKTVFEWEPIVNIKEWVSLELVK
jgi:UDP-glucose 4-epimerase